MKCIDIYCYICHFVHAMPANDPVYSTQFSFKTKKKKKKKNGRKKVRSKRSQLIRYRRNSKKKNKKEKRRMKKKLNKARAVSEPKWRIEETKRNDTVFHLIHDTCQYRHKIFRI